MSSGHPLKKSHKVESGAQLLARLNSRTDLSSLDPDIFYKSSSSSRGQIIEVHGTEGTGKTEMLLHYIAKACLPSHWNGHSLNGLGSKVIFIDTEFKFSVFRLAIVMEKQILSLQEKIKQQFENDLMKKRNLNCSLFDSVPIPNEAISASGKFDAAKEKCDVPKEKGEVAKDKCDSAEEKCDSNKEICDVAKEKCYSAKEKYEVAKGKCDSTKKICEVAEEKLCLIAEDSQSGLCQRNFNNDSISSAEPVIIPSISGFRKGLPGTAVSFLSCKPGHDEMESEQSQSVKESELTSQDVEEIVQDALGRVQVMHVLSTDHLLVSLLSLEQLLSCDPLISMVVIDTISAFYWTDKLGDLDNHAITDIKMRPIANTISKLVSEFGITFLVTKSALIGKKRMWKNDGAKSGCVCDSSDVRDFNDMTDRNEKGRCEHVKFLGKTWSGLSKKRLVLTRREVSAGRETRTAWSTGWAVSKLFNCTDDGFTFL